MSRKHLTVAGTLVLCLVLLAGAALAGDGPGSASAGYAHAGRVLGAITGGILGLLFLAKRLFG